MFQVCSLDLNKNTKEKYSKTLPTAKTTLVYFINPIFYWSYFVLVGPIM